MTAKKHFEEAQKVLNQFLENELNFSKIESAAELMANAVKKGNIIISCGNGGSMCDAMHFAEELTGRYRNNREAIPAISINDPAHITCVGNDYGFDEIFSRYIEAVGKRGDVLLAISTSGNSANIIKAVQTAKKKNINVVGLTGKDGGILSPMCEIEIRAPYSEYADRAQEIHIKVIHALIDGIEQRLS
ncbi:MAG: D-sedoheptulose 7-phosphate isomerase [Bacteroidetes bacterium]|nr:D-sedoheptulose 7-phosphate isomerase [Bacteroidota bacterium]